MRLPHWPHGLNGFKIAVLADFHIRDRYSMRLGKQAVAMALEAEPDMVVLPGDLVGYWKPASAAMLGEVLEPLLLMNGSAVAVPGNHDYWSGTPELMAPILDALNIKLLRNESWKHNGIQWVGIDSANMHMDDPEHAFRGTHRHEPTIVVWHEPDPVDRLPHRADLQISGHSHGGQFRFPGGFTPMHTDNGRKYVRGFYPIAPTPIYVSRGIGTTGPPSRLNCAPEVSILTLLSGE